jgi:hypothetical protein
MLGITSESWARWAGAGSLVALLALTGCKTAPTVESELPPPPLRLIDSQPLVLAEDCNASGSFIVEFNVLRNGRTDQIRAPAAPACVQQAMTAWVASFRYAPPPTETTGSIEWMLVSARKGS